MPAPNDVTHSGFSTSLPSAHPVIQEPESRGTTHVFQADVEMNVADEGPKKSLGTNSTNLFEEYIFF